MNETRDESGRLVSVVVDGQRFHRAPGPTWHDGFVMNCEETDAERWRLRDEVERLRAVGEALAPDYSPIMSCCRTAIEHASHARDRELSSLRGVVQAVRDALAGDVQAVFKVAAAQQVIIDSGLAAAADAPQPEPDPPRFTPQPRAMTCDHGRTQSHQMLNRFGFYTGSDCPGPSPAVLPQPAPPAPTGRGFATPEPCDTSPYREMSMLDRPEFSPSPAVLPETSETKDQR